jgi:hypothetical protein
MLPILYAVVSCRTRGRHSLTFHDAGPAEPAKPRLLGRVRAAARLRHYSRRTEAAHVASHNDMSTRDGTKYASSQPSSSLRLRPPVVQSCETCSFVGATPV